MIQGGRKFDSRLEGRRGWFTIFHVEATKEVTSILKLVKKYSFGKEIFFLWFARLGVSCIELLAQLQ